MYKVMIIDDEPFALSTISNYIKENFPSKISATTYESSHAALAALKKEHADIIITDIRMPSIDGLQLIEEMQKFCKTFIPIVISGYGEFSYAKKAMQMGVTYYLLKPIDYSELKQALNAAIYKLQQNKNIITSIPSSKENHELFFINLTRRQFSSKKSLQAAYTSLNLPCNLDNCHGTIIRINVLSRPTNYHYDLETFSNVWENLVRFIFSPEYVCTIGRTTNYYDLVLIGASISSNDYNELFRQAEQLLELKMEIHTLATFDSLYSFVADEETFKSEKVILDNSAANIHDCIKLAITYIETHYAEDLTRETVANAVHISSSYFSTLFMQETGVNFLNYLTEVRMKKAISLLNTNMKIQDISKAVGYNNYGRFLSNFRNYTSYAPGEYRRDVLKLLY